MGRPTYAIVEAPESEPLTLAEAKAHLKVRHDAEDDLITGGIVAARQYLESQWGLAIITQTWKVLLDEWPASGVLLRPYPVASLASVGVWTGSAFTDQDLASYQLIEGRPAWVILENGAVSPSRTRQGIKVQFVAGFGDADAVPETIKRAMLLLVAHWYRNREASISAKTGFGVSADLTRGVEDLMASFRSPRLR